MGGRSIGKIKRRQAGAPDRFSGLKEFLAINVYHRDTLSVFHQLASHEPETNFLTSHLRRRVGVFRRDSDGFA